MEILLYLSLYQILVPVFEGIQNLSFYADAFDVFKNKIVVAAFYNFGQMDIG